MKKRRRKRTRSNPSAMKIGLLVVAGIAAWWLWTETNGFKQIPVA